AHPQTCLLACSIRSMMKSLRPNHLLFLQLLIAFSGGFGAEAAAIEAVADRAAPLYMLRGQSAEFWCRHDPGIDISGAGDLAVAVQVCSKTLDVALQASDVTALAVVLGRMTSALPSYRSVFGDAPSDILRVFRINRNDPLIQDGTVSILHGNSSVIALTIRDRPGVQALCAFCGQLGRTTNYVTTSKQRVQVVSRPEARLSLNNQQLSGDSQSESELKSGENFVLGCSGVGSGGGRLSVRLEKSGKTLAQSPSDSVLHSVINASSADSGVYTCYVTSDLEHLAKAGEETGSASVTLRVSFAPIIELDEVVRFTRLGETEDIQLKVSAYPEPRLTCRSKSGDSVSSSEQSSRLTVKERYSPENFYATFVVTFSNLNEVTNETLITCTAENSLGSREVDIRLTALAPTPEIVSGSATNWWNSYDLRWQHHVKANVDYYRIRVLYMGANNEVLNQTEQRLQNFERTDNRGKGLRQAKNLVFDLSPDTAHNISLQACNRHGCSRFSKHVRVHTAPESVESYNDPRNPVFAEQQSDKSPKSSVRQHSDGRGFSLLLPAASSLLLLLTSSSLQ
ncbi:hypothetical protein BOX15_Mlig029975g2, partial [Macrostomum lignano]